MPGFTASLRRCRTLASVSSFISFANRSLSILSTSPNSTLFFDRRKLSERNVEKDDKVFVLVEEEEAVEKDEVGESNRTRSFDDRDSLHDELRPLEDSKEDWGKVVERVGEGVERNGDFLDDVESFDVVR